jgi:hypothetical protein
MAPDDSAEQPVRLVSIHPVADFDRYLPEARRRLSVLGARGVTHRAIYRAVDDPNEVLVILDVRSRDDAEALLQADSPEYLDRAGVSVYPPIFIGALVDEAGLEVEPPHRSSS